jgi:hypothetical protein
MRDSSPRQPLPQREVEVRPRKQEKVWMWIAIVLGLVLLFLFLKDYLRFNAWVLIAAGVVLILILLVVLREVPPPDMYDIYRKIKRKEFRESHTYLPSSPVRLQAQPYGKYLLLQAWVELKDEMNLASYWWELQPGRVLGRRIMPIDDIMLQMDKSKIATMGAQDAILRYEKGKLLESSGF